jgi:hypothetical protein
MFVNKNALLVGQNGRLRPNTVSHYQLTKNQPTRNLSR